MPMATQPKIQFILSVDTEEEWDWSGPFPQQNFAVENIKYIPEFQAFCQKIGIKPSYFVDYAVANNPESVAILAKPLAENQCEIAGHLHPWCNPPYFGQTGEKESHVINLPLEQVEQKLATLTDKLTTVFGQQPNAFRTGRWGISGDILQLLVKYGYQIDSSVYPFYKNQFFSCHGAPTAPYWPDYQNELTAGAQQAILQLPVTVGFNQSNFTLSHQIHEWLSKPALQFIRPIGIAWHLGLLKKLYMSPELSNANEMICLAKSAIKRGDSIIHMYLHSSSLMAGATGFVAGDNPLNDICQQINKVISYLQTQADVEFCTISQAGERYFNASAQSTKVG